jgi:arginase
MTRPTLIEVPYDLGRAGVNGGAGASVLAEALQDERCELDTVECEGAERNEIAASMAVVRALAERVRHGVAGGSFPVVLAGNCHSSLGTVAGIGGGVGAVWLDAHADFNTPDTSPTGFFDGMALALLTGAGWPKLRESVEGLRPIPEEHVVLVGARDLDEGERTRLAASRVRRAGLGELDAALDALRDLVDAVYLHVDLDVLDPTVGQANPWSVDGGLQVDELAHGVDSVGERFTIRAAAFTAYWPDGDPERVIPKAARTAFEHLLASATVPE